MIPLTLFKRMHHALQIQEILLDIFDYFSPCLRVRFPIEKSDVPNLVSLARTCRTFKDPALDVLWKVLKDMSPLARCLSKATRRAPRYIMTTEYSFTRSLTQTEWDILRSYTHRIRSIQDFSSGLNWESVSTFLNPPTDESLFPNLLTLRCNSPEKSILLLRLPLPSLVVLDVHFVAQRLLKDFLEPIAKLSPNIRELSITTFLEASLMKIEAKYIARWQNLCSLICPRNPMNLDALVHLSRTSLLTRLEFVVSATLPASGSPLVFSNLDHLRLQSESLDTMSRFLSRTQLPVITNFEGCIEGRPSIQELSIFLAYFHTSNAHTIQSLTLQQFLPPSNTVHGHEALLLDFEKLKPCMVFKNLHHLQLDIEHNVVLTDSQLLTLASAWPKLKFFLINETWGWNSGGITLDGLVRLLQTCRSLRHVAICIDTRGYTEVPPSHAPDVLKSTTSPHFSSIHVLDSVIELGSVSALVDFFLGLATCSELGLYLYDWGETQMREFPNMEEYSERWSDVSEQLEDALSLV